MSKLILFLFFSLIGLNVFSQKPEEEWHIENKGVLKLPIEKYSSIGSPSTYNFIPGYTHLITKVYQPTKDPYYCLLLNNKTLLVEKAYKLIGRPPKLEYNKKFYSWGSIYSNIGYHIEVDEFDYLNFSEKSIYSSKSDLELAKKLNKEGVEGLQYNPKHNQFYFYNREKNCAFILEGNTNKLTKFKGVTYFKMLMPLDNDLILFEGDKTFYIDAKTLEKVKNPTIIPEPINNEYIASNGYECSHFCSYISVRKNNKSMLYIKVPRSSVNLTIADTIKKKVYYWHDTVSTNDYDLNYYEKIKLNLVDYYGLRYTYNNAVSSWEKENAQRNMNSLYTRIYNTCDLKCYKENGVYFFSDQTDLNRYLSYTRVLPEYQTSLDKSNFKENYTKYRRTEIEKIAKSLTWQEVNLPLKPLAHAYPNQSFALGSFIEDQGQTVYTFWDDMFYKISNSTKKIQLYQPLLLGYKQVIHLSGDSFYVANEEKVHLIDMAQGKVLKELALNEISMGLGMRQLEIDESGNFLIITFDKDAKIYYDLNNNKLIATDFDNKYIGNFINSPLKWSRYYIKGYPSLKYNERDIIFPNVDWNISYTGEISQGDEEGDYQYSDLYCGIRIVNAAQCNPDIVGFYRKEKGTFEVYQDFGPDLKGFWKADLYKMTFDEEKPEYCQNMTPWVVRSAKKDKTPAPVSTSNVCKICDGKAVDLTKRCSNYKCKDGIVTVTTRETNVYSGGGVAVVFADVGREQKCGLCNGSGKWVCQQCRGTGLEPLPRKKKKEK